MESGERRRMGIIVPRAVCRRASLGAMGTNPYEALFAQHRSAAVPNLWPWQSEVLAAYAGVNGDAAVELPTGTGKTLIGLLAGEHFRQGGGGRPRRLPCREQTARATG
jgi:hypothetical protein